MRLIDANALMETIKSNDYMLVDFCNTKDFGMYTIGIQQAVDEQPTIEPTAPRGVWVKHKGLIECNVCGFGTFPDGYYFSNGDCFSNNNSDYRPTYCPNCGAKMDKTVK